MKRVNVGGVYQGPDAKVNGIIDHHQKDLAKYLARVRGPGPSEMKFKLRPRPAGEPARAVVTEYEVPLDPAQGTPNKYVLNDGSDWSLGTPSALEGGRGLHDAWADFDGNLWFTNNSPSPNVTVGRIDGKTGAVKYLKVQGLNGWAANAHGMTRDKDGHLWFNVGPTKIPNHGGLARLDPQSETIEVFDPPAEMMGTGGAVTVDIDGKGKVWVSAPQGVLRFDPETKAFTEFKSLTPKNEHGTGLTYGVAADRDGNGWWAEMAIDIVGHSDVASGKSLEVKLPPLAAEVERTRPEDRKFYEAFAGGDFNTPVPWSQGPRRMGADKAADIVWVCDYWGGNLARIDTKTFETRFVALPDPDNQHPYHAQVDRNHNVWINMMNADEVMRLEPQSGAWTAFDLPSLGAETRYLSLDEHGGGLRVVLPYSRTMKVAVMGFRTEAEIEATRARSGAR
jgi:streptogramin lyase